MRSASSDRTNIQFVPAPTSSRLELGTARHAHDYAVRRRPSIGYPTIFDRIGGAARVVYQSEKEFVEHGVVSPEATSLIELEKYLLDISAYPNVTQGVYYMLAIRGENVHCVRFFESGSFIGFFHKNRENTEILPPCFDGPGYRVYTEDDIKQRANSIVNRKKSSGTKRSADSSKARQRNGEDYTRNLNAIKKHIEVLKEKAAVVHDDLEMNLFVHIVRKNPNLNKPHHRYVFTFRVETNQQVSLESSLLDFRLAGSSSYPKFETLDSDPSLNLSVKKKMDVLCCLSNNHHQPFPTTDGKMSSSSTGIGYPQYLSYQPPLDDDCAPQKLPTSYRNRFIYFTMNNRPFQSHQLLRHVFGTGTNEDDVEMGEPPSMLLPDVTTAPKKTRKVTKRVVKVTSQFLADHSFAPNKTLLNVNSYANFCVKIVEVGSIVWRLHSLQQEYFIFNSYSDGGELLMNSFEEVTYHREENGYCTCTCDIYRAISSIVSQDNVDEDVLPDGVVCLHCRFFTDHIVPRLDTLINAGSAAASPLEQKLQHSRDSLNNPVVKLSDSLGTQKYSVRPQTSSECALVHISASGIMATCNRGTCQAANKGKRSVKRLLELEEASTLCQHLATMLANKEVWAPLQPPADIDFEEEGEETDHQGPDIQDVETVVQNAAPSHKYFDPTTGKWDFGGYSVHKPVEEDALVLDKSRKIQARMQVYDGNPRYPRDSRTGCFTGMKLIPIFPDNTCECGSPYKNEQHPDGSPPIEDFTCTLYMRHGPIRCKVFLIRCLNTTCGRRVLYSGKEDFIFLWSKQVAAADEIGWDFINRVLHCKISFSSYCDDLSRIYASVYPSSAPFMNKSTFVSWFFAWCGRMGIDFREHIDPWCRYSPKSIAGDGTHIGLSYRRSDITPIERVDTDEHRRTNHKRFNRVFLPYQPNTDDGLVRKARKHLKTTSKRFLSEGAPAIDIDTKALEDDNLLAVCPQDVRCKSILEYFLKDDIPANLKQALAILFLLLSSDAAVSTVLPHRFHADVLAAPFVNRFKAFCPELGHVLEESSNHEKEEMFIGFLHYLVDFVNSVHQNDVAYSPAAPVENTYNPESGVAYYFTPHGNIVRRLPKYDLKSASKNHDDEPCEEERCHKKFGRVSVGGWTYLFLWFCPIHGHCYGFHIIHGSEGRKDPFSSVVRYMAEPPKEMFYDFACSLSEYSLNREPDFFRNTRVWHDVFHGVTHICGKNFKSRRVVSFTGYNTEICEQFNSFLQCIKYTGTHLSQSHFCFFVQFLIYIWNTKKTAAFQRKLDLARAGFD